MNIIPRFTFRRSAMPEIPKIIKSKSDSKDYRLITLNNGLRALLISDVKGHESPSKMKAVPPVGVRMPSKANENSSDLDESDTTESVPDSDASSDISSIDEPVQRKKRPPVAGGQKKQAAAALCINVGSFSDPAGIPGLAHFLEHMVFMGSEKYPDENKFDAYIRLHGGSDNACTDSERTVFQFEIQPSHFADALDIWSQFFVSPLLKQDSVDREVKAVDSEFDMALNVDDCRKEQLLGTFFPKGHPMSKFMWGNKLSLSDKPLEKGIDVYGALKDFHKAYYAPHFMTLALQSPEKLDTLEEWARDIFEKVPHQGQELPKFAPDVPEITSFQVVKVTPVRNIQEIHLTWVLPPQQRFYRVKPLHYVSWLVGHEGTGSILSLLKQKNLALALCGGNQESGFEQNSACSLFNISITLTDKGFARFCEVLDIVYQYFAVLRKEGASERVFREIQKIENIDFMFQEDESPIENVVKQAGNVLLYPEEDILTGDNLLLEYDPVCIENVLNALTPDRCIVFLSSPDFKNLGNASREPWFGTSYLTENLPEKWKQKWTDTTRKELDPNLHLPSPNDYIAEKFELKNSLGKDGLKRSKYPRLISHPEAGYKLWFKQDDFFHLPKACIRFHLANPISLRTPQDTVCLELLVHLLVYNLAEVAYDADAASLTYGAEVGDDGGLILKFSGYNDKLPLLVDTVTDYLIGFKTSEEDFKQRLLQHARTYYNTLIKPGKLAKSLRLCILRKFGWSSVDKYKACRDLTFTYFSKFVKKYLSSLYIESLIQGNYTEQEASAIVQTFVEKANCAKLTRNGIVNQRILRLGGTQKICKVKALNPSDDNSMVTLYFQADRDGVSDGAMMRLLEAIMDEPCFDILRTKQQLGYSVFVQQHNTSGILGLTVNVGTQNSKFSVEETSKCIMEFVTKQMTNVVENMKPEDFEAQLRSLIAVLKNEDNHLGEEVDRNWHEILSRDYLFDRVQKEIEFLQGCSHSYLKDFFTAICVRNDKVLHVQVRGNSQISADTQATGNGLREQTDPSKPMENDESMMPPPLSLEFLNPMVGDGSQGMSKFTPVSSIERLKNTSSFFPVSEISK